MIRELYLKKSDAIKAAEDFVRLWGGWAMKTWVDDRTSFNYIDRDMNNIMWSGELAAVQVYGCRNGMAGVFAWWEE